MFAIEVIPSLCNHFPTMMFLTSTCSALPCLLNEFISVLQYFSSVLHSPTCKFGVANCAQYSKFGNVIRNIQNKLGNRALKSDLKSTVIRFFLGNQLGYVYLQPTDDTNLILTSKFVDDALFKNKNAPRQNTPWPDPVESVDSVKSVDPPVGSNFRMCFVNYGAPQHTNYGHPEYQLLSGDQLTTMINDALSGICPQYVILYSTNLPCVSPTNPPVGTGGKYRKPRCAPLTVMVRDKFAKTCPKAAFYLYTSGETPDSVTDPGLTGRQQQNVQNKIDAIDGHKIIWLHP